MHFAGNSGLTAPPPPAPPLVSQLCSAPSLLLLNERRKCFSPDGNRLVVFPPLPGVGPGIRCSGAARRERTVAGHGERLRPGGRRWRQRAFYAGGGPASGRSTVGFHRAGRTGAWRTADHL